MSPTSGSSSTVPRRGMTRGALRAAIAEVLATGMPPRDVEPAAVEVVAERLAGEKVEVVLPTKPVEPLDGVARRIADTLAANGPLGRRDLRQAPWCLWSTTPALAAIPGAVDRLAAAYDAAGRRRLYAGLAAAWADGFDTDRAGITEIGALLAARTDRLGDPWSSAAQALSLFDPQVGPKKVASRALEAGTTPTSVLEAAGLGRPQGYLLAAHRAGFERMAEAAVGDGPRILATVTRWTFEEGEVRFEALRAVAVEAAVVPFGRGVPDGAVRGQVLDLALRLLGDPRSETSRWVGAGRAEPIVRRWLEGTTLNRFFETIEPTTADDPWAHRRAFWTALWEHGHVDATRIVIAGDGSSDAATAAVGLFGEGVAPARLAGSDVPKGATVLLLRVGTLVIADWSHGSPCFIWDEERGERGPDLARDVFTGEDLRKVLVGDTSEANQHRQGRFLHRGSAFYKWQGAVADYLRGRRGILLDRSDYELRA